MRPRGPARRVGRWDHARGSLGLTIAATLWIQPSAISPISTGLRAGPDRVPARLIDSNLDWGQDLVGLRAWWREHDPGQPIGLAYFGQINPSIFGHDNAVRPIGLVPAAGETGIDVALLPMKPGLTAPRLVGPGPASLARLLRGERHLALRARLAALRPVARNSRGMAPVWNAEVGCVWLFPGVQFEPIEAHRPLDLYVQSQSARRRSGFGLCSNLKVS